MQNDKHLEIIEDYINRNKTIYSKRYFYTFSDKHTELCFPLSHEELSLKVLKHGSVAEMLPENFF